MIHHRFSINLLPLRNSIARSLMLGAIASFGVVVSSSSVSAQGVEAFSASQPIAIKPTNTPLVKQETTFGADEIRNYALSVLDLENLRQQWSARIADALDVETLPAIACNEPNSIRDLNRDIREMVVQFCEESINIVAENNLSVSRFNAISQAMISNPELQEQISEELLNLQRDS
jgi:hypothetical protein